MAKVNKDEAGHIIGRLSGVKEGDSKVEAALKVIEALKSAGLSTKGAEKMLADYRKRTGE